MAASSDILVCTPMRPAASNTPAMFKLPPKSCDSHFHVFETGYPAVARPLYTFPDGTLRQYLAMCEFFGIERMVLVQPTYYGNDNALTLDTLKKVGPRCRAVVRIEEDTSDAELDCWHKLGVRAIRLDLFARSSWPTKDIVAYVNRMAARAKPRGWHLQFYTPGTIVRDLVPFMGDFDFDYCIDHMGYMLESDGLMRADFDKLLAVMKGGKCWIKLSGPYRIAKSKPLSSVAWIAKALVAARPDRLIWGTDWPHLTDGQRDTGELVNLLVEWAPDDKVRKQILVDGPERLFYFD